MSVPPLDPLERLAINPTGMKGLKREKVIHQVKNLINASYSFQGYLQFSNEIVRKKKRLLS